MLLAALRAIAHSVPTVFILAAMVGIGFWGHHSHWSIPSFGAIKADEGSPPPADDTSPQAVVSESTSKLPLVRFDSPVDVQTAGLATVVANRTAVDEWVPANAVVAYNSQRVAQLSCPVAGRVHTIRRLIGQTVHKGDVLALIDAQEVGQAKSEYLRDHLMARYRAEILDQLRTAGSGIVPTRSLLEAEAGAKEAELRRFTAYQRLLNLGLSTDGLDKRLQTPQELSQAIQFLGLPPEVVAELNPRPTTANLFPLIAPFDGVVIRQDMVPGEVISPEVAHLEVADVENMWIKLSVRMEDGAWLNLGQEVEFTAQGLGEPVRGTLTWVSTEIHEKTRTIQARSSAANPVVGRPGEPTDDGLRRLRANLFGSARIRVARHLDSVVVPDAAVQRMPDRSTVVFVALADGTSFEARTVRLGLSRSGVTQILAGIAPGERVVTRGSYVLKSELMKDSLVAD